MYILSLRDFNLLSLPSQLAVALFNFPIVVTREESSPPMRSVIKLVPMH